MEIFKLFEATIPEEQSENNSSTKDLRREQLIDIYDKTTRSLHTLIQAKENELAYRRDLVEMIEKSRQYYDAKLIEAKKNYQTAKKNLSGQEDVDKATTANTSSTPSPSSLNTNPVVGSFVTPASQQSSSRSSDQFDLCPPTEMTDNRSSLDRRLTELMTAFPNLSQAGSNTENKPSPGYYTQQQMIPPPPVQIPTSAPPLAAMMRFPPPSMIPPPSINLNIPPPPMMPMIRHDTHGSADMELSDAEDSGGGMIPMVASAMQQGAGGKNEPIGYSHHSSATSIKLAFDPSITDSRSRVSPSSSTGSRDKYSSYNDRNSSRHRHSSSSGGSSSSKHGSPTKSKYSSPTSMTSPHSTRSKRR